MRTGTGTRILRRTGHGGLAVLAGVALVASVLSSVAAAGIGSLNTPVSGTVTTVDGTAVADPTYPYPPLRMLRYVGNPATGYIHSYQWAGPELVVQPETAPVVIQGRLDLSTQVVGSVALIGFLDRDLVAARPGYQSGAYIYVYRRAGEVWIGPTDGNYNGEVVQVFDTIPNADLAAAGNRIDVRFTVDGTADGTTCRATPLGTTPPGATPAGCMTLAVSVGGTAYPTLVDSYGEIKVRYTSGSPIDPPYVADEFAGGAVPGWDNSPSGGLNDLAYDLVVDPDEVTPLVTDLTLTPSTVYEGEPVDLTADVSAVPSGETVQAVDFTFDGGSTWTPMTPGTPPSYAGAFDAPMGAGIVQVCVRAQDGLAASPWSSESTTATEACSTLTVVAVTPVITFDGVYYDADGNGTTTLRATVAGGPDAATDGIVLTFDLTPTPAGGDPQATTDGQGAASTTIALEPGVYDVTVLAEDPDPYTYTPATGVLVVFDPNAASTGGGWYRADASPPKVNFGYAVQVRANRRTGATTISGQVLWMHADTVRFRGTVTGYTVPVACPVVGSLVFARCATVTGVGTVSVWTDPDGTPGTGDESWDPVETGVAFTATVADGGQASLARKGGSKQAKPDAFGMLLDATVDYAAEDDPIALNGGNLVVK